VDDNGKISGYSIYDINGANETKAKISGTFNAKTKKLFFKEDKIIKTKSDEKSNNFCMMEAQLTLGKKLGKDLLSGKFKGYLFNTKTFCGEGEIWLTSQKTALSLIAKNAKKIDTTLLNDTTAKRMVKDYIDLKNVNNINEIKSGEKLNLSWKSDTVKIELWDDSYEDGDMIQMKMDGKIVLDNYTITKKRKTFVFAIQKTATFEFTALSEGEAPPNTVKIILKDKDKNHLFLSSVKLGKTASIIVQKK